MISSPFHLSLVSPAAPCFFFLSLSPHLLTHPPSPAAPSSFLSTFSQVPRLRRRWGGLHRAAATGAGVTVEPPAGCRAVKLLLWKHCDMSVKVTDVLVPDFKSSGKISRSQLQEKKKKKKKKCASPLIFAHSKLVLMKTVQSPCCLKWSSSDLKFSCLEFSCSQCVHVDSLQVHAR